MKLKSEKLPIQGCQEGFPGVEPKAKKMGQKLLRCLFYGSVMLFLENSMKYVGRTLHGIIYRSMLTLVPS